MSIQVVPSPMPIILMHKSSIETTYKTNTSKQIIHKTDSNLMICFFVLILMCLFIVFYKYKNGCLKKLFKQ